jgi:hypothetical protein
MRLLCSSMHHLKLKLLLVIQQPVEAFGLGA